MRGVAVILLTLAVGSAVAAAATESTFTVKPTLSCLLVHKLIASQEPKSAVVPPNMSATGAIAFSFALIPAQAVDGGSIVFERNAATASRVRAKLFAQNVAQAEQVQGISLAEAKATINASLVLNGNTITEWRDHPVKAASRRRIAACLR